jgi:hypothetical protein
MSLIYNSVRLFEDNYIGHSVDEYVLKDKLKQLEKCGMISDVGLNNNEVLPANQYPMK